MARQEDASESLWRGADRIFVRDVAILLAVPVSPDTATAMIARANRGPVLLFSIHDDVME